MKASIIVLQQSLAVNVYQILSDAYKLHQQFSRFDDYDSESLILSSFGEVRDALALEPLSVEKTNLSQLFGGDYESACVQQLGEDVTGDEFEFENSQSEQSGQNEDSSDEIMDVDDSIEPVDPDPEKELFNDDIDTLGQDLPSSPIQLSLRPEVNYPLVPLGSSTGCSVIAPQNLQPPPPALHNSLTYKIYFSAQNHTLPPALTIQLKRSVRSGGYILQNSVAPMQSVVINRETICQRNNIEPGTYRAEIKADNYAAQGEVSTAEITTDGQAEITAFLLPVCRFTYRADQTSLTTASGCLTGYSLIRTTYNLVISRIKLLNPGKTALLFDHVVGGQHWLLLAGQLQELNETMRRFCFDTPGNYFKNNLSILIGAKQLAVIRNQQGKEWNSKTKRQEISEYNPKHPRINYFNEENSDLEYYKIAGVLRMTHLSDDEIARHLLQLLKTGSCGNLSEHLPFAACLVHIFGVEANKNNLSYATSLMALELVGAGQLNLDQLFANCDPQNKLGLKSTGGLLSMASWLPKADENEEKGNAGTGLLASIVKGDENSNCEFQSMRMMKAMQDQSARERADGVIPKKEMTIIVKWCKFKLNGIDQNDQIAAQNRVQTAISDLLDNYYAPPPQ